MPRWREGVGRAGRWVQGVGGGVEDHAEGLAEIGAGFGVEPEGGLVLTGVAAMDAVGTNETRGHGGSDRKQGAGGEAAGA